MVGGWQILEWAIHVDHIHLFVRVFPTTSAAEVVKERKGVTARAMRAQYPVLLKLPSLWTRSYFASTADNVSSDIIPRYIERKEGCRCKRPLDTGCIPPKRRRRG
ncbi:MAG: IS200/IS605 family transposase [Armatimonadetes bacterium]|nr:IS200/IS605 family transposase [Armatimonadota bacterium]